MSTEEPTPLRLLVVDGDDTLKEDIVRTLRRRGDPVSANRVEDVATLETTLSAEDTDLVLLRPGTGEVDPAAVIAAAGQIEPPLPVLLLTADGASPATVGARDRVDPAQPDDLVHRLRREASDLADRRRLALVERRYRDSERRAHELVDRSRDPIAYIQEGILVHVNPAFRRRLGEAAEPEGTPLLEWLGGEGRDAVKRALRGTQAGRGRPAPLSAELRRTSGHSETVQLDLRHADYQGEAAVQLTLQSGGEESALRQRVRRLEHQDPVTGLFNRQHFLQTLEALQPAEDSGTAVVCLTVDHFDDLRERLNPAGADALLARVSERLRRRFSPRHHLARFQGARFTALVGRLGEPALERLGQALCREMAGELFEVGEHSLPVSASIGIASWDGAESPVELLERAFTAAREATGSGGNATQLAPAPGGDNGDGWLDALEQAMEQDRLVQVFQPVGDVRSAATHGGELLVRLRDSEGTLHPPGAFLPAARRGGLMPRLDRHTLEQAATRLARGESGPLFIKIAAESLEDPAFTAWFGDHFTAGTAATGLVVELAEVAVVAHLKAAVELGEVVRAAGGALALEHFGTAPDGEAAQERLRADYLKIDGEIIDRLDEDPDCQARLEGIVRLAGETGATTIAERVEHARTLPLLWQMGVDRIQGYFLHAPADDRAAG